MVKRFAWLFLLSIILLAAVTRSGTLISSVCDTVLFVSLSRDLVLQAQDQSALGMITTQEWEKQPISDALDSNFCGEYFSPFGKGLSLLWHREWASASQAFEISERGDLTALGSYTADSLLDESDRNMTSAVASYFLLKGDHLMHTGMPELAETYIWESVTSYPTIAGYLSLAHAYERQGLGDEKILALQAAQTMDPADIETQYLLAVAQLEKHGQTLETKEQLLSIVEGFNPTEPDHYALIYKIYMTLADLEVSLENTAGAVDWLELAIELPFVQTHRAQLFLGRLYLEQGLFDEAWLWHEKVRAARPDDPQTYIFAGDILKKQGNIEGAAAYYEDAIALMPSPRVNTYNKLAQIYKQLGRGQEARRLWQRVLEVDPDNQQAIRALEN